MIHILICYGNLFDTHFDPFWQFVTEVQEKYDINTPRLPRRRKIPAHFEISSSHVDILAQFNMYIVLSILSVLHCFMDS